MGQQRLDQFEAAHFVNQPWRWAALEWAQRMHVDGSVQRGRTRFIRNVRIGALFEQHVGEVVMRVDDGDDEGGASVRVGEIQVRAPLRQNASRVYRSLPCRIQQSGPTAAWKRSGDHAAGYPLEW